MQHISLSGACGCGRWQEKIQICGYPVKVWPVFHILQVQIALFPSGRLPHCPRSVLELEPVYAVVRHGPSERNSPG